MKMFALLFGFSAILTPAFAESINPLEASKHVGQTVSVRGVVDEVHTSGKGNTFLDLGGKYPDQAFTGVIFKENTRDFPNVQSVEGKNVSINGPVQIYRGKPEIILRSPSQLNVEQGP